MIESWGASSRTRPCARERLGETDRPPMLDDEDGGVLM